MVRQAGLPELVATSEAHYLDAIHQLVDDDDHRASLQQRLARIDLDATIFGATKARPSAGRSTSSWRTTSG